MKLKKKITALCAAILLLVAASLCAAMLWQVREQSYGALLQRSLDSLDELAVSFETAVYQTSYEMGSALSMSTENAFSQLRRLTLKAI
mgnify:CR=1 FL=1